MYSEHCRRGTSTQSLASRDHACTKGFDCHVLLLALNQEFQFDPNKFNLSLDKKVTLGDKSFLRNINTTIIFLSDQHYCNSG